MTSWGNTKQRACLFAGVGLAIISLLCSIEATNTTGPTLLRAIAVFSFMLAAIAFAGIWSMGLTKDADAGHGDDFS